MSLDAENAAYLCPFLINVLTGDGGVGVRPSQHDVVALGDLWNVSLDGLDGFPLFIGFCQRGLKLLVGCD